MPPTQMRRADREMTDETWIKKLLHRGAVGYLATVHEARPFINSNLYVYDEATRALQLLLPPTSNQAATTARPSPKNSSARPSSASASSSGVAKKKKSRKISPAHTCTRM